LTIHYAHGSRREKYHHNISHQSVRAEKLMPYLWFYDGHKKYRGVQRKKWLPAGRVF
jgi:hypothetical protein